MKKKAVIVGAGPAGLTAGYEFLKQTDIQPILYESTSEIGGISRTIVHNGNRMDIGGHRFFSKNDTIMNWWQNVMPLQGAPAFDEVLLNKNKTFTDGPNPQIEDNVILLRERVSRIFYLKRFFDYPISAKLQTFINLGIKNTFYIFGGYIYSLIKKQKEDSLENFYINRFGRPLYKIFFEDYTQKVWGIHPSKLGADWGSQRIKGLSIISIIKNILLKPFKRKSIQQKETETSLIEQFIYPKFGPGQLWENIANSISNQNGIIEKNTTVVGVNIKDKRVHSVTINNNGNIKQEECDYFLSSMPIKDLINAINGIDVPCEIKEIANNLPYRDFISVGVLVKDLSIKNSTKIKTYKNRIPDTWIYIQEPNVKIGRIQIFNNWSPYMVKDYENTIFLGLEYFCSEDDELWNMPESEFIEMAICELEKIQFITKENVIDTIQVKTKKAYPAYYGSYEKIDIVKSFLDSIENLYCIGRNGQHRYNNMDHSMLTAIEAVNNIKNNTLDKTNIWSVNTEQDYHEKK